MTASTSTAKIYTFPPRGRFALRMNGGVLTAPAHVDVTCRAAAWREAARRRRGWYHDEAIQEEHDDAEPRRKN